MLDVCLQEGSQETRSNAKSVLFNLASQFELNMDGFYRMLKKNSPSGKAFESFKAVLEKKGSTHIAGQPAVFKASQYSFHGSSKSPRRGFSEVKSSQGNNEV